MEDILEAEEESPQGALKIAILEEDDLDIFAENQYVVKDALCLWSDVPELLEKALRLYQGRAFWDGTGDLDDAFLAEMDAAALADLLIVSQAEVTVGGALAVAVAPAQGEKCERCWKVMTAVGRDKDPPGLCPRCAAVVRTLAE